MGTNYYLVEKTHTCPTCETNVASRTFEIDRLHIGKSSAGWCFALHSIPEKGLTSLDAWKRQWLRGDVEIVDEYEASISPGEMESIITQRDMPYVKDAPPGYASWKQFYACNHGVPGPNNLIRHAIGTTFSAGCVAHGEGTWDMIEGEFS